MQKRLPMHLSRRCRARTRSGKPCQSPAVHGKRRCRMHGGGAGSGGQPGNRNAYKHGAYSAEAANERRKVRMLIEDAKATIEHIVA